MTITNKRYLMDEFNGRTFTLVRKIFCGNLAMLSYSVVNVIYDPLLFYMRVLKHLKPSFPVNAKPLVV